MPYSYYDYLDPIHIVWRKGTAEDPYIPKVEYLQVANGKVVLAEIPDKFSRVKIAGLKEINYDGVPKKNIAADEFSVNYSTGVIELHSSKEALYVNVSYLARGLIQYPASRIYHQNGDVVETLDNIIENAKEKLEDVDDKIADYQTIRDQVIESTVQAEKATAETYKAIEAAEVATGKAIDATEDAIDAYNSTIMIYLNPVATYNDIARLYPNPVNGSRVMVTSTGNIYRYDGIIDHRWELIDNYTGGSVPIVNDAINGLMRKEDYTKLHTKLDVKTITFVIPKPEGGSAKPLIRFPMSGTITNVYAYCATEGLSITTQTSVQKMAETDFINGGTWADIATFNILVNSRKSETAVLVDTIVNEGDYFRIYFNNVDDQIEGMTVQIDVKI